jgi:hypothetical protein
MRKVFWDNPCQHTLTTHVTCVAGNQVLFDATIAYCFAGGQESYKAYINGIPFKFGHEEHVNFLADRNNSNLTNKRKNL